MFHALPSFDQLCSEEREKDKPNFVYIVDMLYP